MRSTWPHDQRYARADEFVELVLKLWNSWQPDALVLDKVRGILADPGKIDAFKHSGTYFDCEGPLNIPRVPQGQPVLIQAGASGRGRQFGSRWAEVIFSINSRVERMLEPSARTSTSKCVPLAATLMTAKSSRRSCLYWRH